MTEDLEEDKNLSMLIVFEHKIAAYFVDGNGSR
jgi:hypothetical protein